jgi:demethylmenaquinone methyltransferase/2-methoxy-6-polyprenyl-1,4-benzoquinol methylase
MAFSKKELKSLYRKRSRWYDFSANLYYLIGFREWAYRKSAVTALNLKPGDTVVEIGCGTGLNFSLLQRQIGERGHLIGVDLTDDMLDMARQRVEREGWSNVDLVHSDAANYEFASGVNGIVSTFALTLSPDYDEVIRRGAQALAPGGRFVVADLKLPTGWSGMFLPLLMPLFRPFGVTRDLAERHPWESLQKYFDETTMRETYFGYTYIATGTRPKQPEGRHDE